MHFIELDLSEGHSSGVPTIQEELEKNGSPKAIFHTDEDRRAMRIQIPIHPAFIENKVIFNIIDDEIDVENGKNDVVNAGNDVVNAGNDVVNGENDVENAKIDVENDVENDVSDVENIEIILSFIRENQKISQKSLSE